MGICQAKPKKQPLTPSGPPKVVQQTNESVSITTSMTSTGDPRAVSTASEMAHSYWRKDGRNTTNNNDTTTNDGRQYSSASNPKVFLPKYVQQNPTSQPKTIAPPQQTYDSIEFIGKEIEYADPDEDAHIQAMKARKKAAAFNVNPTFDASNQSDKKPQYINQEIVRKETSRRKGTATSTTSQPHSMNMTKDEECTVQDISREDATKLLSESQYMCGDFVIRRGRNGDVISTKMEAQKVVHFAIDNTNPQNIRFKPHDPGVTNPCFGSLKQLLAHYRQTRLRLKDSVYLQTHIFKAGGVTYATAPYVAAKAANKDHKYENSVMEHKYMNAKERTDASSKVGTLALKTPIANYEVSEDNSDSDAHDYENDDVDDDRHDYENDDFDVSA